MSSPDRWTWPSPYMLRSSQYHRLNSMCCRWIAALLVAEHQADIAAPAPLLTLAWSITGYLLLTLACSSLPETPSATLLTRYLQTNSTHLNHASQVSMLRVTKQCCPTDDWSPIFILLSHYGHFNSIPAYWSQIFDHIVLLFNTCRFTLFFCVKLCKVVWYPHKWIYPEQAKHVLLKFALTTHFRFSCINQKCISLLTCFYIIISSIFDSSTWHDGFISHFSCLWILWLQIVTSSTQFQLVCILKRKIHSVVCLADKNHLLDINVVECLVIIMQKLNTIYCGIIMHWMF